MPIWHFQGQLVLRYTGWKGYDRGDFAGVAVRYGTGTISCKLLLKKQLRERERERERTHVTSNGTVRVQAKKSKKFRFCDFRGVG